MWNSQNVPQCGRCGNPLRTLQGAWSGVMPSGFALWLCKPCAYLMEKRTPQWGLGDLPADMRPTWNGGTVTSGN